MTGDRLYGKIELGIAQEDHEALERLAAAYMRSNHGKLRITTTVMELAIWSAHRVGVLRSLPPLPSVCSHCGRPMDDPAGHVCEGGPNANPR